MTFSTRGNPRIAQSGVALTSLGAVGGARGTAAGALRVFVEFLTTYDKQNLEALEDDLRQLDHAQNNSVIAEEKRQRRLAKVQRDLTEIEKVSRGRLNTALRSDLKEIEALEGSRSKHNRETAVQLRNQFNAAARARGATQAELGLLARRSKLERQRDRELARQERADKGQTDRLKQRVQLEGQLSKVQAGRAALGPRLAGLAIGAVGGIIGGAILGVGFQLADTAIRAIGDAIQDIVDPSRHARESIAALGEEVANLAKSENLTFFEAAAQKAAEFGLESDRLVVNQLALAAASQAASEAVKDYIEFLKFAGDAEALERQSIKELTDQLVRNAIARGELNKDRDPFITLPFIDPSREEQAARRQELLNEATEAYNRIIDIATRKTEENARAKRDLADANALASIAQERLNDALQTQADAALSAIDARIDALELEPSARTQSLEAALERAQGGSGSSRELQNIAEERSIILLRQRLRLLGENINLEQFSGRFLLEAINARIAALQKQGDEQDRLNKLLDLQFRASQTLRRQQGETISDFIQRRAQENRQILTEQADLQRQALISELQDRKESVQDEVALAELAERRREVLRREGLNAHIKSLQKQLEESRKADKKTLENKRQALEAEKRAIQEKVKEAGRLASQQSIEETLAAIRGAKSLQDLSLISGRIAGLQRAKGTIEELVKAFGIPDFVAKPFLDNINKALSTYLAREEAFVRSTRRPARFQHGGVFDLNNGSTAFGQNVRTGEAGSEIGVVLSNKVAAILQRDKGGNFQQTFNLYGSSDPFTDRHNFKRMVKEAVSEALSR